MGRNQNFWRLGGWWWSILVGDLGGGGKKYQVFPGRGFGENLGGGFPRGGGGGVEVEGGFPLVVVVGLWLP